MGRMNGKWRLKHVAVLLGLLLAAPVAFAVDDPNIVVLISDYLGAADLGYRGLFQSR
jgi:hypothetical protein